MEAASGGQHSAYFKHFVHGDEGIGTQLEPAIAPLLRSTDSCYTKRITDSEGKMTKMIHIAFVSVAASALTSIMAGTPFWEAAFYAWLTPTGTLILWCLAVAAADRTYRRFRNMDRLQRGVCPNCDAFGSLVEVTSADPLIRKADCQACNGQFEITMTHRGLACDYIGVAS